jgi:pimeloyl-ACP methyl ester carboxylesterase
MERTSDRISGAFQTLQQHPRLDASRNAYVGISFGAWLGIVAASQTAPLSRYVLMAPPPSMSEFLAGDSDAVRRLRSGAPAPAVTEYLRALSDYDAAAHIRALRDVPILFQWAAHDQFITREAAEELTSAAGPNATSRWYDVDHPGLMEDASARSDRLHWIRTALGAAR